MAESSSAPDPSSPHQPLTNPWQPAGAGPSDSTSAGWLGQYPWATFLLPLAVYMLAGTVEPSRDKPFELLGFSLDYSAYPIVYAVKLALTLVAMAAVWP